jgi:cytidyltransferase-like protein
MISGSTAPFHAQRKILPLDSLPAIREQFRDKSIVLCHGAFDLVHMGHLLHFEEARALGDILVVTITADRHITKRRAVSFSEEYRARQLAALEIVDYVAIVDEPSAATPIERLHPDVYVKGPEYADLLLDGTANIVREKALVEQHGGRIHFTNGATTFSSTKLAHFLLAAPEASQSDPLLTNDRVLFRDLGTLGFTLEQLKGFLAAASRLRVCVIGETIIDEWVDVTVTNLSQKSRCVAGLETARSRQVGGAGAIAEHISDFVKHVDFYTNGLTESPAPNIAVRKVADESLVKTRFVDRDTGYRLFESKSQDLPRVRRDLPDFDDYDVVLVADFGHGLIDAAALNARIGARRRAFVAGMAQVNSTNYGYNLPTKFSGLDYCSVNRTEAELCLRERGLPLPTLLDRMVALLDVPSLSVTDGERGAMVTRNGTVFAIPTVSTSVVDTVGCGDAYFALSSLAAALGCPAGIVALAGSIAAAAAAQRRGNACPTSAQEFLTIGKIVI